ncbi:hypothetical protein [Streptomyces sp. NPDC098781]|uniref:hypothetical protein n=1 Tax=Streptomyces sp. NPDC098781 TaxID=3366097 RepID=UPI00381C0C00
MTGDRPNAPGPSLGGPPPSTTAAAPALRIPEPGTQPARYRPAPSTTGNPA